MNDILVSIILPVFNEGKIIVKALQALQGYRQQGHELIIVDGGSKDDTMSLASSLCDRFIVSGPGRALQMNAGVSVATHDIFLFLHVDSVLPDDALLLVGKSVEKRHWGRFNIKLEHSGLMFRIIETAINWRSALTGVATGDQAIFVTRQSFESCGGYPEIPLMEDIALSRKLRKTSWPVCLPSQVSSSARRWQIKGIANTILLMWKLRFLYFLGVAPEKLVGLYYPNSQENCRFAYPKSRIIVFAKEPVPGKVKTRLIPAIGAKQAADIHKRLFNLLKDKLIQTNLCPIEFWVDGNKDANIFKQSCFPIYQQQGEDLGERMINAATSVLSRSANVILIGCDCPDMDAAYLQKALESLHENDVVLGPAEDGGYVLIGLKKMENSLFKDVSWGGNQVLKQTEDKITNLKLKFVRLLTLADIDRPEDLNHWQGSVIVDS